MSVTMQVRRGTAAAWTSANPTLVAGEWGFETDTYKFKIGDGVTAWTSRPYYVSAVASHTHSAADLTSGTLDIARIADGSLTSAKLALSMAPSWTGIHTHSQRPVFNGGVNVQANGLQVAGTQVLGSDFSIRDVIWDRRYNPGSRVFFAEYGPNLVWNALQRGYTQAWSSLTGVTSPDNVWIPDTNDRYATLDMATVADPLTIDLVGTMPTTTNIGSLRIFIAWHGSRAFNSISFEVQRNDDVWVPVSLAYASGGLDFSATLHSAAAYPTYTPWKAIRVVLSGKAVASGARYIYGIGLYGDRAFAYPYLVNKIGDTLYGTFSTQTLQPRTHNGYDLGASGTRYKDLFLQGAATIAGNVVGSGTVQGTRLISTQATGTAPLTVSSTTVVTNLNADLFEGQHGSFYQNADNLNAGTIPTARVGATAVTQHAAAILTALLALDGTGSTLDADLLDGYQASAFPRKAENATIDGAWIFDAPTTCNDDLTVSGGIDVGSGASVTGSIAVTGTVDGRDLSVDGTKLDGIAAGATVGLAAADQALAANRAITGAYYLFVNLIASGKTALLSVNPANPNISISANDGAGNVAAGQWGSAGFALTLTGAADFKINSDPGTLNAVPVSQGAGVPPVWKHLCPPIRYAWTDFYSPNASQAQDPYFGTALVSGVQSASPAASFLVAGVAGLCLLRSSTSADSGYRWITENTDRIVGQADLFFRAILAIADDMTNKTVRFGFGDMANQNDAVDGTYFELTAGSLVCTPKTASNSTRTSGSTFTLTAGTYYVFEVYWTSTSSVNFKIKSLDEATIHLDTNVTTNIPTGTSRLFGAGIVATSSGTATDDLLVIDYMGHGFKNRR